MRILCLHTQQIPICLCHDHTFTRGTKTTCITFSYTHVPLVYHLNCGWFIATVVTFHLNSVEACQVFCHSLYNHQFQMDQSVDMAAVQVKTLPNK